MSIRIDDEGIKNITSNTTVDDFISNRVVPTERIYIEGITSGRLITSQV